MFSTLTFHRMKHSNPFCNFINSGQSQKAGSEYWQTKIIRSSDICLKSALKLLCSTFSEDETFNASEGIWHKFGHFKLSLNNDKLQREICMEDGFSYQL